MVLGKRLRELRKEKKLTQKELADMLHISRSTYAQYEVDRRIPEYSTLQKIADFYGVSIDYIVGRSDYLKIIKDQEALFNELNLSDDELLLKIPMKYEGMELTTEEKREFLAIVRGIFAARKALKEKD